MSLTWLPGFHFLADRSDEAPAEGLTLVHLHCFDREQARARHEARRDWRWQAGEQEQERGLQWTLEGEALEAWLDEQAAGAEPVAGWLREQVPF